MRVLRSVAEMGELARLLLHGGRRVGLVPTMGALHEGHRSLILRARRDCDTLVVSLFLNPAQFGRGEDLQRYPRDFEADSDLCRASGVDILFAPTAGEMYPPGFSTWVEAGEPAARLEGRSRPGHFRGVATVVLKLLEIVRPSFAVFGQKDAQQVAVIRRMVSDLNLPVAIVVAPTMRDQDGLALSSRNRLLSARQRRLAPVLHRALREADAMHERGVRSARELREAMRRVLAEAPGLEIDYAEVVDGDSFRPLVRAGAGSLLVVAGRLGPVRLIDNLPLSERVAARDAGAAPPTGAAARGEPSPRPESPGRPPSARAESAPTGGPSASALPTRLPPARVARRPPAAARGRRGARGRPARRRAQASGRR